MQSSFSANDQPPTNGKIVLYTSHGQLEIELWSREAPLACRNFVQLCLEDYYVNTIFHRVIPGFMIQGGDPTGTGSGGQSIYGKPFKDEFHQRLKFIRRGIVAMANCGKNANGSQFFITFGECEHINKKHTIFGKIVGDTIYNLMAMQSLDTDGHDRPNDPPCIRKIKVITNPFDDIQPRTALKQQELIKNSEQIEQEKTKKALQEQNNRIQHKQQLKQLKKKNKLTFDIDEQASSDSIYRAKSAHDVLHDQKLSNQLALTAEDIIKKRQEKQLQQAKKAQIKAQISAGNIANNSEQQVHQLLREQLQRKRNHPQPLQGNKPGDEVLNYQKKYNPETKKFAIIWSQEQSEKEEEEESQEEEIEDEKLRQVRRQQLQEYEALKIDQLNFKKAQEGSHQYKRKRRLGEEKALLSNADKRRYEYLQKSKLEAKEDKLLEKLNRFTAKLNDDHSWMTHKLKFHIDSDNAYKLQEKKAVHAEDTPLQLDDGGLKIEYEKATKHDLSVDDLYNLIHKQVVKPPSLQVGQSQSLKPTPQ